MKRLRGKKFLILILNNYSIYNDKYLERIQRLEKKNFKISFCLEIINFDQYCSLSIIAYPHQKNLTFYIVNQLWQAKKYY